MYNFEHIYFQTRYSFSMLEPNKVTIGVTNNVTINLKHMERLRRNISLEARLSKPKQPVILREITNISVVQNNLKTTSKL